MLRLDNNKIIAIGASTGGVEALTQVLSGFPVEIPPVLLVIHMPPGFTKLFAQSLNDKLAISIKEAQSGDYLIPGQVLIAPAGKHMKLVRLNGRLAVECYLGERVSFVIPSADVLFESVANIVKQDAIGVIMTGLGADGASGLLKMYNSGAVTIGQNKETCIIYGMPKVAKELGAVKHEVPLNRIAPTILSLL